MTPVATTPFGRRSLSLAMVTAQAIAKACPGDATGHKWKVFRDVTEAKDRLDLNDRALAVLNALLTFHPDTALTPGADMVVFPSNRELSVRAHGPSMATLRRSLAHLVEAGIVIRRDSPNGKRYARRGEGGEIERAFGFDLTPLVARATEFDRLAQEIRADQKARRLLREEISLHRRDIAKTIAAGLKEGWRGPWSALAARLRQLGSMPPRSATAGSLEPIAGALRALRLDVDKSLEDSAERSETTANESRSETHQHNSKPETLSESEPGHQNGQGTTGETIASGKRSGPKEYPLRMVLEACPDVAHYSRHEIAHWKDFLDTVEKIVRPSLGISSSAWKDAVDAMGEIEAAIVVVAILQRGDMIRSAGGYLRNLTAKARSRTFSAWPMILALLRLARGLPRRE